MEVGRDLEKEETQNLWGAEQLLFQKEPKKRAESKLHDRDTEVYRHII